MRAAQICGIIANTNRGKDSKPFKIQDFMLFDDLVKDAPPAAASTPQIVGPDGKPLPSSTSPTSAPGGATLAPETMAWLFTAAKVTGLPKA